jgi:quinol monooxygenase YgiN
MYLTVLTGQVAHEDWTNLQHAFSKLCAHPPVGLVETELVQDVETPNEWLVITMWSSQEAYDEATKQKLTAACEQMFCDMGSVPRRTQYKLVTRYERV